MNKTQVKCRFVAIWNKGNSWTQKRMFKSLKLYNLGYRQGTISLTLLEKDITRKRLTKILLRAFRKDKFSQWNCITVPWITCHILLKLISISILLRIMNNPKVSNELKCFSQIKALWILIALFSVSLTMVITMGWYLLIL